MARDRRAAGALEHREEGALGRERGRGVGVVDGGEQRERALVVAARLDGDDPLPDRRQEFVDGNHRRRGVGEPKPLQAGKCEHDGVGLAGGKLAQACLHVAAHGDDREIAAQPLEERLATQRGGADGGARRQLGERLGLGADEDIARVLAWEHRRDCKSRRQDRRHVFRRMHGEIDGASDERLLDFLGEEALAAGLRQRPVADDVAGGADHLELEALRGERMRGGQAIAHLFGLGERERAAARADDERRGSGRGPRRGLHPITSQCYAGRSRPRQRSPDGAAAKSGRGAGIGSWMVVLGIETTCDETAAAVVERPAQGRGRILSNIVLSQIDEHAAFCGVVPEIAARAHVEALDLIIAKAMAEAGRTFAQLDGLAAAAGPGLIGGVIVGLTTAKAIALVSEKPLIAVNHLEAHALTARLTDATPFPYCLFLASGGHTQIVAVLGVGDYVRLGTTVDDAIGEAFDKTAKLLGLPYPGGPKVELEAARGDAKRFSLPRPMVGRPEPNFSLSGLKTALRLEAEKIIPLSEQDVADLCASFQQSVVEVVADRLRAGLKMFRERYGKPNALVAAGGVAANQAIRKVLHQVAFETGTVLVVPPAALCTDNGAMIAWAGAERLALGLTDTLAAAPHARWSLHDVTAPPPPSGEAPAIDADSVTQSRMADD